MPWLAAEGLEPLRRPFAIADLAPHAHAAGVSETVLVQTVASLDETREFLAIAEVEPLVAGVVGWLDLTAPDVADQLDRLRSGPGGDRLVSIRHLVQSEPDPDWLMRSEVLAGLRAVRDAVPSEVAAGEYGYDLTYFAAMVDSVDCLQADVTRCGGITEFLRVAALAEAHGRDVSAHGAPHLHAAVMAAIPNGRHLEWFHDHVRIEEMFFDGVLSAKGGTVTPDEKTPGLGLAFKESDAAAFRVA
jgi:hypothetical protein